MSESHRCRIKVGRAKVHIADLEARIEAFREGRPYRAVFNGQLEDGFAHYGVVAVGQPPMVWSVIVGDVLHNLRSSLDYAWRVISGTEGSRRNFPILTTEGFETGLGRAKKPSMKKAVEILRAADVYKAGCPLMGMASLNNLDKHEDLLLVASRLSDHGHWREGLDRTGFFLGPLEANTVLARQVAPDGDVDEEYEIRFEITFGKIELVEGKAVVPTLADYAVRVDHLIESFHVAGLIP